MSQPSISDESISDAYLYLLGRLLVLRQMRLDFEKEGFAWNELVHRERGGVAWANPNLDVVYSEAWLSIGQDTCLLLEIPQIDGRYYTWHVLNGWGETVLNINERTFPQHPFGTFALCVAGSVPKIPADALRVDLPGPVVRVLARVELGAKPDEAIRLQRRFTLTPQGAMEVKQTPKVPLFANANLPDVSAFENALEILDGEPDINEGMGSIRATVRSVAEFALSGPEAKQRIDGVIKKQAWPRLRARLENWERRHGWIRGAPMGNYGNDFVMRTLINMVGIWANNSAEAIYLAHGNLDGGATYVLTFPADALPASKARYFWSIIAVDTVEYRVLPNSLNRYLLNNQTPLQHNADGSLTLVFSPKPPEAIPESNWLPTKPGLNYNLTFRLYGPSSDVANSALFPPPLIKQ
jgi:hypothetical protein